MIKNQVIGQGNYATVYYSYNLNDEFQTPVATKIISKTLFKDDNKEQTQKQIQREATIQKQIDNPYILKLRFVGESAKNVRALPPLPHPRVGGGGGNTR